MQARGTLVGLLLGALAAPSLGAQPLARRVEAVEDGVVRMSFAARAGVCGNGRNITTRGGRDHYWQADCESGPVRVLLAVERGRVVRIRTYVGGRWRDAAEVNDLGTVDASEAVDYLLGVAERLDGDVGKQAIFPVVLAEGVTVWPRLLRLARDGSRPRATRKAAVFWIGQSAADEVTAGLDSIVADDVVDLEIRESAIFALSQRPEDEGVPALIRIARTSPHPELRRKALFWLAQSGDERAIALFEEILTGGN